MNASLLRRLARLETAAQEAQRRTVRAHLAQLTAERGIRLSPEALERIVTDSIEPEPRIRQMEKAGIPAQEIADTLIAEIKARKAQQCEEG
jgi:hypothetical protein